jgi:hypothetical protein
MTTLSDNIINLYKEQPHFWIFVENLSEWRYYNGETFIAVAYQKLLGMDDYRDLKIFLKSDKYQLAEIKTAKETKDEVFKFFVKLDPIENNERFLTNVINTQT